MSENSIKYECYACKKYVHLVESVQAPQFLKMYCPFCGVRILVAIIKKPVIKKVKSLVGNYVRIKDNQYANLSIPSRYFNRIGFCDQRIGESYYVQFKNRQSKLAFSFDEIEVVEYHIKLRDMCEK